MIIDYKQLGLLIKMKRKNLNLSYDDLMKITGIRRGTLLGYENKGNGISVNNWLLLKKALNITDEEVEDLNKSLMEGAKILYGIK